MPTCWPDSVCQYEYTPIYNPGDPPWPHDNSCYKWNNATECGPAFVNQSECYVHQVPLDIPPLVVEYDQCFAHDTWETTVTPGYDHTVQGSAHIHTCSGKHWYYIPWENLSTLQHNDTCSCAGGEPQSASTHYDWAEGNAWSTHMHDNYSDQVHSWDCNWSNYFTSDSTTYHGEGLGIPPVRYIFNPETGELEPSYDYHSVSHSDGCPQHPNSYITERSPDPPDLFCGTWRRIVDNNFCNMSPTFGDINNPDYVYEPEYSHTTPEQIQQVMMPGATQDQTVFRIPFPDQYLYAMLKPDTTSTMILPSAEDTLVPLSIVHEEAGGAIETYHLKPLSEVIHDHIGSGIGDVNFYDFWTFTLADDSTKTLMFESDEINPISGIIPAVGEYDMTYGAGPEGDPGGWGCTVPPIQYDYYHNHTPAGETTHDNVLNFLDQVYHPDESAPCSDYNDFENSWGAHINEPFINFCNHGDVTQHFD